MSAYTGTWQETLFSNRSDYTAFNTSAAEGSILAGLNEQPKLEAGFFDKGNMAFGRVVGIRARGILGTTGTPTIIFQLRLGTTVGSTFLSGTSIGVTAAITTINNSATQYWELNHDITCNTPGQGTGNTTLSGGGSVTSPGGFAAPYIYPLEPTTPPTATWTSVIDNTLTYFLNISVTWSASSLSNTIICKSLQLFGRN